MIVCLVASNNARTRFDRLYDCVLEYVRYTGLSLSLLTPTLVSYKAPEVDTTLQTNTNGK